MFFLFSSALAGQPSKMLSDEAIGKKLYLAYCWNCHGELADGLGPQASSLQVAPPALIKVNSEKKPNPSEISSKDPRIEIILNGKGYMPGYGQLIDKHEARRVLIYLQDLESDFEKGSSESKKTESKKTESKKTESKKKEPKE
ncbi:MAG: hypothetical protein CMK59_03225 [Proteobacteria bacterium]|nr:hypothetical protein [Pseudomonadota bacterium]